MPQDEQGVLHALKSELSYVENGGYGAATRNNSRVPLLFEDSSSCLSFESHDTADSCSDCFLMQFVPADKRNEEVPCRHIPMTAGGQTLLDLYRGGTQTEMEDALAGWLGGVILQLEAAEVTIEKADRSMPTEEASA